MQYVLSDTLTGVQTNNQKQTNEMHENKQEKNRAVADGREERAKRKAERDTSKVKNGQR